MISSSPSMSGVPIDSVPPRILSRALETKAWGALYEVPDYKDYIEHVKKLAQANNPAISTQAQAL
jgi:hypothetical protein